MLPVKAVVGGVGVTTERRTAPAVQGLRLMPLPLKIRKNLGRLGGGVG